MRPDAKVAVPTNSDRHTDSSHARLGLTNQKLSDVNPSISQSAAKVKADQSTPTVRGRPRDFKIMAKRRRSSVAQPGVQTATKGPPQKR